jgi:Transport and Golgi organisation 2
MCSVSFVPRNDGFILAMNRDELISRGTALPPEIQPRGSLDVLCPREAGGGTWIGINSAGMAFSLLNWHSQPDRRGGDLISRGEVVRALLSARTSASAASLLRRLPVGRMNPFRLTVISLPEGSLHEWRSGGESLEFGSLPWARHHWFSSGLDEATVDKIRRQVCSRISDDMLDLSALRDLHRSHLPTAGAFSICMHRKEAGTVSYTEIEVRKRKAFTLYVPGPPCAALPPFRASLTLDAPPVPARAESCCVR